MLYGQNDDAGSASAATFLVAPTYDAGCTVSPARGKQENPPTVSPDGVTPDHGSRPAIRPLAGQGFLLGSDPFGSLVWLSPTHIRGRTSYHSTILVTRDMKELTNGRPSEDRTEEDSKKTLPNEETKPVYLSNADMLMFGPRIPERKDNTTVYPIDRTRSVYKNYLDDGGRKGAARTV